jgi:hypothetical protein
MYYQSAAVDAQKVFGGVFVFPLAFLPKFV